MRGCQGELTDGIQSCSVDIKKALHVARDDAELLKQILS
jgi:hypothetical protein